jgi:hypothetical protein
MTNVNDLKAAETGAHMFPCWILFAMPLVGWIGIGVQANFGIALAHNHRPRPMGQGWLLVQFVVGFPVPLVVSPHLDRLWRRPGVRRNASASREKSEI